MQDLEADAEQFDCRMTKLDKEKVTQTMERSDLAKYTYAEYPDDEKMIPIYHQLSHSWLIKSRTLRFSFCDFIASVRKAVIQDCLLYCRSLKTAL